MDAWIKTGSCRRRNELPVDQPSQNPDAFLSDGATVTELDCGTSQKPKKMLKLPHRKYNSEYLKYGFIASGPEGEELPQCVLCYETLANESMKPSKLERHLQTKHTEYGNKPIDFFKNKKREFYASRTVMEETANNNRKNQQATIASYQVSLHIAKKGAAHTVGEELILPAAKIISGALFTEKHTKRINEVALSNTTVKRRIEEMADNVKEAMITRLKQSDFFALQLDESTDVADMAMLSAFVRFEFDGKIDEELLFCKSLPTTTTGEEIFKCLDSFIKENCIDWSKCVGLTTDGARAMSGVYKGLIAKVRAVAPAVQWTHCSIHREALAVKGLSGILKKTLDEAVKLVNYIKSRPKKSRLFAVLCDEMGSEHRHLLLHCEVRWLSRGKVLSRLFELRDELRMFLTQDGDHKAVAHFLDFLNDEDWLKRLAYLSDIFSFLNTLNLALQGKDVHKFYVQDKIEATLKKIARWGKKLDENCFDAFPTLHDFIESNGVIIDAETARAMKEHLTVLASSLRYLNNFNLVYTGLYSDFVFKY